MGKVTASRFLSRPPKEKFLVVDFELNSTPDKEELCLHVKTFSGVSPISWKSSLSVCRYRDDLISIFI